ncbi:hypothetical protein AVEN_172386-1 [Araneus ventricosus]|uniref:Uncharacterized protein n=1 Tax=Araneus ventricosus TaxID=182803 RepID=A0A4Y2RGH6_ARAVE|nr:hypothetical protein AVEN_172386-1 [Araneus ventricosus]
MKETYETLKHMLSSIEYSKHSWHICADLKVIAVLVGLQAGYTKFFCFLCQWDSRDRKKALHQEEFYPENLGPVSDEHGERFHQDISNMGVRYGGKWNSKMLADYIWTLKMDIPQAKHSRQAKYTRK